MNRWWKGVGGLCATLATAPVVEAATKPVPTTPLGNPVPAIIQLVLALVIVIGGIIFVIKWLARRAGVQTRGAIEVLAARQLAPNRSVQVIAVYDKRYLIGVGDVVSMLADVTDDFPDGARGVATGFATGESFEQVLADRLAAVRGRYQSKDEEGEQP